MYGRVDSLCQCYFTCQIRNRVKTAATAGERVLTGAKVGPLNVPIFRVAVKGSLSGVRDLRTGASVHSRVSGHVEFQGNTINLSSIIPIT